MEIVRLKLSATQIAPASTRYNSGTGTVQFSPDGGTTWVDAPELDPRTGSAYQLPADPTANPQCDAAERAIDQLHDEIDQVLAAVNAVQLASYIFDAIALLVPGIGIIFDAILLAASALLSIGATTIDNAFSTEAYDTLKCLWFNRVGTDGIMTADGMTAWQDDIQADGSLDAAVATVTSIFVDSFGLVQLNNAAVKRDETGDCIACGTWCREWLPGDGGDWTLDYLVVGVGSYTGGEFVGIGGTYGVDASGVFISVSLLLTDITVTHIEAVFNYNRTDSGTPDNELQILVDGVGVSASGNLSVGSYTGVGLSVDGSWVNKTITVRGGVNTMSGSISITHILMRGTGTAPEIGSDCS